MALSKQSGKLWQTMKEKPIEKINQSVSQGTIYSGKAYPSSWI